jgi:hypothetical protein
MKRHHWLALAALLLLVTYSAWQLWSGWGLITIHSDNQPLSEIVRSIEKQGRVTIKTDLEASLPVRMHVDKVALAEALETLGAITEARWRLTYLVAPDQGAIGAALASFTARQKVEGWRALHVPLPPVGEEPAVLPDPRRDPWEVQPAREPTLQAYLQQASRSVSASFLFPREWNPPVTSAPQSGPISKTLPLLAKAAGGSYEEVFFLEGGRRGEGDGDRGRGGGDGPRFSFDRGGGFDRDAMEERIQAEIRKLPAAQQAVAKAEHDERRKFFEGLRDLTDEQRRAKFEEYMNDPKNEERMDKGMAARESRRSPQQRTERAQKYRERKQQSQNAAAQ